MADNKFSLKDEERRFNALIEQQNKNKMAQAEAKGKLDLFEQNLNKIIEDCADQPELQKEFKEFIDLSRISDKEYIKEKNIEMQGKFLKQKEAFNAYMDKCEKELNTHE